MALTRKTRRRVLAGTGVVVIGGAAWWQFGRATVEQTAEVTMTLNQFQPRNIRIEPGTEVTWENTDNNAHRIRNASDNWSFNQLVEAASGDQRPSASHTFNEEGVYDVYCDIHGQSDLSGMSMKIGVGTKVTNPLGGWL